MSRKAAKVTAILLAGFSLSTGSELKTLEKLPEAITSMTFYSDHCPDSSWLAYDGNCYKNTYYLSCWSDCQALCANEDATMLCIPDAATNNWIADNLMISGYDLWIGATDELDEGNWQWPSGCSSLYFYWASWGEPNGGTSSNCARILSSSPPAWGDRQCSYGYNCACERPFDNAVTPTIEPSNSVSSDIAATCPDGWTGYDGNCYKNMDVANNWSECEALCASEDAAMLCIPDQATNNWISDNLMIHQCDVWIGLTDEHDEGYWQWPADCHSSYLHWASWGEPNGGTSSNCARMVFSAKPSWADRQCSYDYDCACQKPLLGGTDAVPSLNPSAVPTNDPTFNPTRAPSRSPSHNPSKAPSHWPTRDPTRLPTLSPSSDCAATCPDGWTGYDGNCYKNMDVSDSWSQCQALCASEDATMLCIPDEATNNWISDNLMIHQCDVWIGLTDEHDEGYWQWPADCHSSYLHWASWGEPNGGTSSNCARMVYSAKPSWADRQCSYDYDCACQKPLLGGTDAVPSLNPSAVPTKDPTFNPSPSHNPSKAPSHWPTRDPTRLPTLSPSSDCAASCPDGWTGYDGNCYKNMDVANCWSECEALCASEDATMLCIPDEATNNWISDNLMIHQCDVWIGVTDDDVEGEWIWPTGCSSSYLHWASGGEPNGGTSSNCARMLYSSRPDWADRQCSYNYDCACQKPLCDGSSAPAVVPTPAPPTDCRDGWLAYDGNCYKTVSYDECFDDCNALCDSEGANMLCIEDAATNTWIGNSLMTSGGDMWIGLHDRVTEGQWEWTSNCGSTYFDWRSERPNGGTTENCVRMQYSYRPDWNDRECSYHFDCACQYPISP